MEKSELILRSAIEDLKRHACCVVWKTDTWENKIVIYMKYQGAIITNEIDSIDTKSLDSINFELYERLCIMAGRLISEVNKDA